MATVQCSKCTAERKGFRRELDSWRHKLIHCVGFESILEGIYGSMLMRDLKLFDDCEPKEVDDWSPESSFSHCSFCNLPLDKLSDQVPAATPPLSSPSDYSPCQVPTLTESSQTAHRFLQAVFHKKDMSLGCDSNIPLVAQELMKKMIHQFALEYASKCLLHTSTNGVTTRTSSPPSDASDSPLDLTVSRTQGEKGSKADPDGALDLSNRNLVCPVTSKSSSSSSSADTAAGCLPPPSLEESGGQGQRPKTWQNTSALDAVLSSLCPAHCSLLYQMLKLAHQEKLFSLRDHRSVAQTESHFCHWGVPPQDNASTISTPFHECKDHTSSSLFAFGLHSHGGTVCHPGDSKTSCSIHRFPLKDCKTVAPVGSDYCCMQKCRMETYTVLCPERLHCLSCQSFTVEHNSIVCSCALSPALLKSSLSSICCNHHNPQLCPVCSKRGGVTQVRNAAETRVGDADPPCPVLKREQSPSPPPLSPFPPDIDKKTDEKPPSLLHHRQEEDANLLDKGDQEVNVDTERKEELQHRPPLGQKAERNPSGTLLQDVVNRFSEKLETIRPPEKDPPLASAAVHAPPLSTSDNLQFPADAHLTEIITTVLHTGSASDYSLSELFSRHDSQEPKSPNTRSRRRQEVLAAMATRADDASTRRHSLQIKRELAMYDQSYGRRKVPTAKRARFTDGHNGTVTTSSPEEEEPKRELVDTVKGVPLNMLPESDVNEIKNETQTSIVTEEVQVIKMEERERQISIKSLSSTQMHTPGLQSKCYEECAKDDHIVESQPTAVSQCDRKDKTELQVSNADGSTGKTLGKASTGQSSDGDQESRGGYPARNNESRRSRRSIVPPQRFSSYVTEPRKMFFVACFSENIFSQTSQQDKVFTSTNSVASDVKDTQHESKNEADICSFKHTGEPTLERIHGEPSGPSNTKLKDEHQGLPQASAIKEKTTTDSVEPGKGGDCDAKASGTSPRKKPQVSKALSRRPPSPSSMGLRLRSATRVESPHASSIHYTSPIKLMFVSPVRDTDGVKYSLKSAGAGSHAEESFDPYEESSWAGTPEKKKKTSKSATRLVKSVSSPLKSATSSDSSACSATKTSSKPPKSGSTPTKSDPSTPAKTTPPTKSPPSPLKSGSTPAKSHSSSPKSPSSPLKSGSTPAKSHSSSPKSPPSPLKSGSTPAKSHSSSPKSPPSPLKSGSTPAKSHSSSPKSPPSPLKSGSTPAKSHSSSPKSPPSPLKSGSTPAKSSSSSPGKSASSPKLVSPPKIGSRRSGEGTPTKHLAGTEKQRSPADSTSHETTPPKRRPGRPKKLGPQLEQKVKRPIGRPRKQKSEDPANGAKTVNGKVLSADMEQNGNKNLKITVVYGRSRRNKRTVSESFDQLTTEFHDAWNAVGLKHNCGILSHESKMSSRRINAASTEVPEGLSTVIPVKESLAHRQDDAVPSRKPGRPAKIKISGISVTVTTVSPKHRKIQINKESKQSPKFLNCKKTLLPGGRSAKESLTISRSTSSPTEEVEVQADREAKLMNQPVAVRHSKRVRKPSIYFLHAVATSTTRSYSHSNALLRRSKQLLLNKASNERKQEEQQNRLESSGGRREQEGNTTSQDLSRVAAVSADSIFTPKEALRWWAASVEEHTLSQELARRIQLISDTWVSDTSEDPEEHIHPTFGGTDGSCSSARKSQRSSVVRALFDCPQNKPRSCSMQQLSSWFMQTTETQSLAIVKKASSRNPYEVMHFPRSVNKKSVCHSPQAERLRKHMKKFAQTVPTSPLQHQRAQKRLQRKNKASLSKHSTRRHVVRPGCLMDRSGHGAVAWRGRAFDKYRATLFRARMRFQTRKEKERWRKRRKHQENTRVDTCRSVGRRSEALRRSTREPLSERLPTSSVDPSQEPVDGTKERNLCSKAWSPETLKECRVFLRKINSPDNDSTEEEWNSCTVTLEEGSSAYLFSGRDRELVRVVKAVKRKRSMNRRNASRELTGSSSQSVPVQDGMSETRQSPERVPTEPPVKMLRQSRVRGLSGPRWCDFVFES